MITTSQLTKKFAALAGIPEELIKHRAQRLRQSGLLPNAGRGRSEPLLPPECVASLIIAVMGAETIANAPAAAKTYGGLIPRIEPNVDNPTPRHDTLQQALAIIFAVSAVEEPGAREAAASVVEFAVDRRQPQAYIVTKMRRQSWKQVYVDPALKYDPGRLQEWVTLPGATLRALIAEVVDDAPAKWSKTA